MKSKVLKQNKKLKEDKVVIIRQTEEKLGRRDLLQMKQQVINNQSRLQDQMKRLQEDFANLKEQEKEIDEMLNMIPETSLE